jgi:hypothetical protein
MFEGFLREWEADDGFGVPTRVFSGPSLDDPRTVISIGFVAATAKEARAWLATGPASEQARHDRDRHGCEVDGVARDVRGEERA